MHKLTPEDEALWRRVADSVRENQHFSFSFRAPPTRVKFPEFDPVLDLHHYTIHDAYLAVREHLEQARWAKVHWVIHITGKSGQILVEYPRWIELNPYAARTKLLPNQGSYKTWLKRN